MGAPAYSGEWYEGTRHGQGTLWYDLDKDCFYEGGWRGNNRHGEGRMRYKPTPTAVTSLTAGKPRKKTTGTKPAEGNLYVGGWANDQKNGRGTMEWFDRREKYTGQWEDDQQNGKGEHVWMDDCPEGNSLGTQKQMCNRYVGAWRGGVRHGRGHVLLRQRRAVPRRVEGERQGGLRRLHLRGRTCELLVLNERTNERTNERMILTPD